jgi:uncharacterized Zn-binding protein involved in type VI secretion
MPGAGRLGDKAQIQQDAHGCPGCPHPGVGPAIAGSTDVFINGMPALRVDDVGIHAVCCGPNMWSAQAGSATVFINGKAAFRKDDPTRHCGGSGKLIEASTNVVIGDAAGGGGGSGGTAKTSSSGVVQGGASSAQTTAAAKQAAAAAAAAAGQGPAAAPAQPAAPKPATAIWAVQWPDGAAVGGVKVQYEGPGGNEEKTGARGQKAGLQEGDEYALTLVGTVAARGKVQDPDGKAVAGARLRIERSYGASVDVTTDGSGQYEVPGLVQDEPYAVTVLETTTKAVITLVDEAGKPRASVRVRVVADGGLVLERDSDGAGKIEIEGLLPGEGYTVEVLAPPGERA